ncbi:MAG: MFS transporter [Candidatus Sumerlaeota bacterium]|nr:MFS transporter [Candidatus Sumerlaeota bacterium]
METGRHGDTQQKPDVLRVSASPRLPVSAPLRVRIPAIVFFGVCAFSMDFLFSNGMLTDTFFGNAVFDAEQWQQGVLGCASAFGYAVGCLVFGPLSDRSGRRGMILLAVAGVGVCHAVLPWAPSFRAIVALAVIKRFLLSMYWPAMMAWLTDASLHGNFQRNLCVFNISWTLGVTGGSWLSGHLGKALWPGPHGYNPTGPYLVSAATCAALLAWIALADPIRRDEAAPPIRVLESPEGILFLTKGWIAMFGVFCAVGLNLFMMPRLARLPEIALSEASQSTIHSMRILMSLVVYVAMLSTSHWHFRFYPIYGGLLIGAAALILTGSADGFGMILAGTLCLGAALGIIYTVSQYYSLGIPKTKGGGGGVHEALLGLGHAVGPGLGGFGGWLFGSPRAPYFFGLLPLGLTAGAMVFLRKRLLDGRKAFPTPSLQD